MATADQEQGAHFVVGIGQRYDSVYLRSGTVTVEGFAIDYPLPPQGGSPPTSERRVAGDQPYVPPASTFTAVATGAAYDIGELAFSTYVQAVDLGKEITAIPVFPSRFFPHSQIQVHAGSGIRQPADLVGRRLAIGSFAKNYAVWLRGVLAHQYQVAVEEIIWVEDQPEHFAEYRPQERFRVERAPAGQSVWALLEAGEIDAVSMPSGTHKPSPQVRPLFENPYAEIRQYFAADPIYPINTVLTVPRATLQKNAELPRAVYTAFQRALGLYRDAVQGGERDDAHSGLALKRLEADAGVRLPNYGFAENRRNVETMIQYCHEQGVIQKRLAAEDLFLLTDT